MLTVCALSGAEAHLIPFWILDFGLGKLGAARVPVCELPHPLFKSVSQFILFT
jgi:hypothetical protein